MSNNKINEPCLSSSILEIKGIGPKKAELLNNIGIEKLSDIFCYYPRMYEDFRNAALISNCENGSNYLIVAKVLLINLGRGFGKKRTVHLLVEDKSGRAEVLFFGSSYIASNFKIGQIYYFHGKTKVENGRVTIFHPQYGPYSEDNKGILPVYHLTSGISQKDIRNISRIACENVDKITDYLPKRIKDFANVCDLSFAYTNIHYPSSEDAYKKARFRLVFDELFKYKYAIKLFSNKHMEDDRYRVSSSGHSMLSELLPYALTNAQIRVINEIVEDLGKPIPMNRLVQGDVGCGKTAVAAAAIFETIYAGFQAVLMAPTDILATQHFNSLNGLFLKCGFKTELLTSSVSANERKEIAERIRSGESKIIIGTHALFSESVEYNNLSLIITDEQHRFGVSQREKMSNKAEFPNVLVMSATPIPRTLAAVLYADMDISTIDELPKGRKQIQTISFNNNERKYAYQLLFEQLKMGKQAYIVAPFISESESVDAYCVENLYASFKRKHPDIPCAMLTSQQSKDYRDSIMHDFSIGKISVLISTVIIEVGIDVANATVILIENSERFGLAQLHQLRGRVGRGLDSSYCLLCYDNPTEIGQKRIDAMCSTNDGFTISEMDLELRGPGELFGFKQHGLPQLTLANPIKHSEIMNLASNAVSYIEDNKDCLDIEEKSTLNQEVTSLYLNTFNFVL